MENILFQWLLEPSKLVLGIETTGDWERTQTGEGGGLKSVGGKLWSWWLGGVTVDVFTYWKSEWVSEEPFLEPGEEHCQ